MWYCICVPGRLWNALIEVAVENGGYITPDLAAPVGVPAIELRKMVSRHVLTSAGHGIYRVPGLPIDRYDEFILARLWAKGRGVISHGSALLVHDLCDINPDKVHLTLPPEYRISRSGGEHYEIHIARLALDEIVDLEGVTLTTIVRTLHDASTTVPRYLLAQAVATAVDRGTISEKQRSQFLQPPSSTSKT